MKRNKKSSFALVLTLFVIVLSVVLFLIFFYFFSTRDSKQESTPQDTSSNNYFVIKDWGVKFKLQEGISDVEYFRTEGANANSFSFTTRDLAAKYPGCGTKNNVAPIGTLYRSKNNIKHAQFIKQIGSYKYYFQAAQSPCDINMTEEDSNKSHTLFESIKNLETTSL